MTDYGRAVQFGVFPEPATARLDEILTLADIADRAGLDLIGIQDHPYQRHYLDTWMLIATVLARTERVTVFPDVANLPLRPPAVMAKAAASLDVISGGRFELGLGAGAFWEAVGAMGGPTRSPGRGGRRPRRGDRRHPADVVRPNRSVRFDGRHYRLSGVKPGPQPAHDLGIWLGVRGRRTLALLGRIADGWVPSSPWAPPEKLPAFTAQIDDAAAAAGRDPAAIRRIYNMFGSIRERGTDGFLQGTVEQWTDELTMLAVEHGIDSFVFGPADDPIRQVQVFAAEVAPAVRDAVARHRHAPGTA